ncbi:MAG: SgcJ/EcaC family oxidoreductase [Gemmatimonadota bacterium]|nr:MAG: SgcJ/EcaC family oxidoreductase [Gemmatimonadota bacterium]
MTVLQGADVAAADSATVVGEVYTLIDSWVSSVQAADIEALARLVTPDATFWTHGAPELAGRDALAAAFGPVFARYSMEQDFRCEELVVSGDMGFMRGTEFNRLIPRREGPAIERQQRAFSIIRRGADGRWRFAHGMTNLAPDP